MAEMLLTLKRTVFLPKGSPGICTVREIRADIGRFELNAEGGRIYCSGEADLLIEYLSFAEGRQYPGYEAYEQPAPGGGAMWQALITLPFELAERGEIPCPPLAELTVGELKWFMVAPHALELEMELNLCWEEAAAPCQEFAASGREEPVPPPNIAAAPPPSKPASGWQKITLADQERKKAANTSSLLEQAIAEINQHQAGAERTNIKVIMGGASSNMEKEGKIIRMGVSDQGWLLTDQDEKTVTENPPQQAAVIAEEEIIAEENVAEAPLEAGPVMQEEIMEQEEEEMLAEQAAELFERKPDEIDADAGLTERELGEAERAAGLREMELGEAERAAGLREMELGEAERAAGLREMELGEAERAAGLREMELGEAERAAGLVEQELGEAERAAGLREMELGEAERAAGPVVMMQSVETLYQVLPDMAGELLAEMVAEAAEAAEAAPTASGGRRRVAGMPRFITPATKAEETRIFAGYQVSYSRLNENDELNAKNKG